MAISRSQVPKSVSNPSLYRKAKSKAKAKFDVYPSAYANAYMVKEYKKMGGKYKGKKKATGGAIRLNQGGSVMVQGRGCGAMMNDRRKKLKCREASMSLTKWFKEDWVDIGSPKKGGGYKKCGRTKQKADAKRKYPKCVPAAKASSMSKSQVASAVTRKRAKKQGVGGKPTNVSTFASRGGKISKSKTGNMGLFGRR